MEDENIAEEESKFEMTPEQATSLDGGGQKPSVFNRKNVLVLICISFAVIVGGGLILNIAKPSKKNASASEGGYSSSGNSSEFLTNLRNRAERSNRNDQTRDEGSDAIIPDETPGADPLLPPASFTRSPEVEAVRGSPSPPQTQYQQPPAPQAQNTRQGEPVHFRSSLVPQVQGRLFAQNGQSQTQQPSQAAAQSRPPAEDYYNYLNSQNPSRNAGGGQASDYSQQNDQQNKQSFYDSSNSGGAIYGGQFLGQNSVWTGTLIPGILETAINTDLPGNVLARVTQNIYDSQTGRVLLIPQGTLLFARYNSSVSYAQSRVQIVWDTLIRPDGYQIDLEGAPGVDRTGMSGQDALYSENWFEYLKAAGIITLFSVTNAKMTDTANKYSTESSAANIAEANSQLVNQIGSELVSRAMNIQPTLSVENGTLINIMLNKTLYLPPVSGYPAEQKYKLER
jgi:type IV secretion system protein VirB10